MANQIEPDDRDTYHCLQKQAARGIVRSMQNHVSCHDMDVIPVQNIAEGV